MKYGSLGGSEEIIKVVVVVVVVVVFCITIPPLDILSVVVQTRDMKYDPTFRRNSYYDLHHNCHTILPIDWSSDCHVSGFWLPIGPDHPITQVMEQLNVGKILRLLSGCRSSRILKFWDLVDRISG